MLDVNSLTNKNLKYEFARELTSVSRTIFPSKLLYCVLRDEEPKKGARRNKEWSYIKKQK